MSSKQPAAFLGTHGSDLSTSSTSAPCQPPGQGLQFSVQSLGHRFPEGGAPSRDRPAPTRVWSLLQVLDKMNVFGA